MKLIKPVIVGAISLACLLSVSACSSKRDTKETTTKETTTYVPARPADVIVQAPAPVVAPLPPTTTSSTYNRTTSSTTAYPASGYESSTSTHRSDSTTVTPSN